MEIKIERHSLNNLDKKIRHVREKCGDEAVSEYTKHVVEDLKNL